MNPELFAVMSQKRDIFGRLANSVDLRIHREEVIEEILLTIKSTEKSTNIEEKALAMARCEGMLHAVTFVGETYEGLSRELQTPILPNQETGE